MLWELKSSIMSLLKRYRILLILFGLFLTHPNLECWAVFDVTILDCGQGNTVVAMYRHKTMLFDAGRTGYSKFMTHEDDKSNESVINTVYSVKTTESKEKLKKLEVPSKRYGLVPIPGNNEVYKEEFIDRLERCVLGKHNKNNLQAIFISHPDVDHYNLVTSAALNPNVFVLGGCFELYQPTFHTYVEALHRPLLTTELFLL